MTHGPPPTPLFCPPRGDYEVDFYLRALEQRGDAQKRGAAARNRRLAAMRRLERDGSFFSEHEMRERQPALHHQYIGQYRPPEALQGALSSREARATAAFPACTGWLRGRQRARRGL